MWWFRWWSAVRRPSRTSRTRSLPGEELNVFVTGDFSVCPPVFPHSFTDPTTQRVIEVTTFQQCSALLFTAVVFLLMHATDVYKLSVVVKTVFPVQHRVTERVAQQLPGGTVERVLLISAGGSLFLPVQAVAGEIDQRHVAGLQPGNIVRAVSEPFHRVKPVWHHPVRQSSVAVIVPGFVLPQPVLSRFLLLLSCKAMHHIYLQWQIRSKKIYLTK